MKTILKLMLLTLLMGCGKEAPTTPNMQEVLTAGSWDYKDASWKFYPDGTWRNGTVGGDYSRYPVLSYSLSGNSLTVQNIIAYGPDQACTMTLTTINCGGADFTHVQ